MNKVAKLTVAAIGNMILISGCNDNETVSPYEEILSRPPFASLSDSIKKEATNNELWFPVLCC
jgi:hypothetical protein